MSLYSELKPYEDIIDIWNTSQAMTSTHSERIEQMFVIFEKHTGVDMSCPTCGATKLVRVVNWFNREKRKYQERGAKRKKK